MKMKIIHMMLIGLMSVTSAYAAPMANRALCQPQNANMAVQSTFATKCKWENLKAGDDVDAIITLNGKQNVHAVCQFSGTDAVALVRPFKHADFHFLISPGNEFSFDIKYREIADSTDDNQNIHIYLNKSMPDASDVISCEFTVIPQA